MIDNDINKIVDDWYNLPELIKHDILDIDKTNQICEYDLIKYSQFIMIVDENFYSVTNKFRKLKNYLFQCNT